MTANKETESAVELEQPPAAAEEAQESEATPDTEPSKPTSDAETSNVVQSRMERFKALQARQAASRKQNLKESKAETQRLATDPNLLSTLERKRAIASHKLLKSETPDFERKRAWDWTVEESEAWDKRVEKKSRHREDVAFQDYRQDARKVYKRQLRDLAPDKEAYERQKQEAIQKAAQNGGLEIVETEDGELIAVDRDGTFYSTADSTDFVQNKPDKAAVDRLVADIRKAEDVRLKKRRDRGIDDDTGGDVTYINQKVCLIIFLLLTSFRVVRLTALFRTSNSTKSLPASTTSILRTFGRASREEPHFESSQAMLRRHSVTSGVIGDWLGIQARYISSMGLDFQQIISLSAV